MSTPDTESLEESRLSNLESRTESRIAGRDVEIAGRVGGDRKMAGGVDAHRTAGKLHSILERGDIRAVVYQTHDVLCACIPRGEVVRNISSQAPRIITKPIASRVLRRRRRDSRANRTT